MKPGITLFLLIIVLHVISLDSAVGQAAPVISWQHAYGGTQDEEFRTVELLNDGAFAAASYTRSTDGDVTSNHGGSDYWIVKADSNGSIVSQKTFGGTLDDFARSLVTTDDGGFIVGGQASSVNGDVTGNHGDFDCWILKLSASLDITWKKTFGGSGFENVYRTIPTSDGNYLTAGFTESTDGDVTGNHGGQDYFIVKCDANGNKIWAREYGGSSDEQAADVVETNDHCYLVVGFASSGDGDVNDHKGSRDFWAVKLTPGGDIIWKKSYGGTGDDAARWVEQTPDHGYVITGYVGSNDGDVTGNFGKFDYWLLKIDSAGNIQWQKTFGGAADDYAYYVQRSKDGGYLLAGLVKSKAGEVTNQHGQSDAWIVKCDSLGNLQWQKTFGGSQFDEGRVVKEMDNGNLLIAGFTGSNNGDVSNQHGGLDAWVIKACFQKTFFKDLDLDGYGNPNDSLVGCNSVTGYVLNKFDCNDADASLHPGAIEYCNNLDDDCSGIIDDNVSAPVITSQGATVFCTGGSVMLTAENFTLNNTYQWYHDKLAIEGASASSYTASAGGSYTFSTAYQGCIAYSNAILVTENLLPEALITNGSVVNSCKGSKVTLTAKTGNGYNYQWNKNGVAIEGATTSSYTYSSNKTADFTVTVNSTEGCSTTSATTTVNKLSKPAATVTPLGNLDICNTGQVILQANSGAGLTYKWYKNAVKVSGATNQQYTATTAGDYTVKVTDQNGCKKTSAAATVYSSCKTNTEDKSLTVMILQNPNDGNFQLNILSAFSEEITVSITNIVGQIILAQEVDLEDDLTMVSLKLPSTAVDGIYFVTVTGKSGTKVLQMIVKH